MDISDLCVYEIYIYLDFNYIWKLSYLSKDIYRKTCKMISNMNPHKFRKYIIDLRYKPDRDIVKYVSPLFLQDTFYRSEIEELFGKHIYINYLCYLNPNKVNYILRNYLINHGRIWNQCPKWFVIKYIGFLQTYINNDKCNIEHDEFSYEQCQFLLDNNIDIRLVYKSHRILDDIFILDNAEKLKLGVQHVHHYVNKLFHHYKYQQNKDIDKDIDKDKYVKLLAKYTEDYFNYNKPYAESFYITSLELLHKLSNYLNNDIFRELPITPSLHNQKYDILKNHDLDPC